MEIGAARLSHRSSSPTSGAIDGHGVPPGSGVRYPFAAYLEGRLAKRVASRAVKLYNRFAGWWCAKRHFRSDSGNLRSPSEPGELAPAGSSVLAVETFAVVPRWNAADAGAAK